MKHEIMQFIALLASLGLLAVCAGLYALMGNAIVLDDEGLKFGNPVTFAQATAAARAAELDYQATAIAYEQSAAATATAIPLQASRAAATASTEVVSRWAFTLLGVVGGLLIAFLLGLAGVAWLRNLGKVVWVGANGPVLALGDNTAVDMGKAVGPVVSVPRRDPLAELDRVWRYWRAGRVPPREEPPPPRLTDAGATAGQYLDAAQANAQANAVKAMFSGASDVPRKDKIEMIARSRQASPASRMPAIRLVNDPEELQNVQQLFLPEGSGGL
jgi:hypothetical protein